MKYEININELDNILFDDVIFNYYKDYEKEIKEINDWINKGPYWIKEEYRTIIDEMFNDVMEKYVDKIINYVKKKISGGI